MNGKRFGVAGAGMAKLCGLDPSILKSEMFIMASNMVSPNIHTFFYKNIVYKNTEAQSNLLEIEN